MNSSDETENGAEFTKPPFLYEIRVKGRLSSEQWTSWFDDLTVSTDKGESTLRGRVPDHSALYGLLARLRDLAVPLVAVKVLDAEAQLRLSRQSRRYDLTINLLLVAIYLALIGGLASITVFVAPIINTALALAPRSRFWSFCPCLACCRRQWALGSCLSSARAACYTSSTTCGGAPKTSTKASPRQNPLVALRNPLTGSARPRRPKATIPR